jgi:hypothetical protein
MAKKFSSFFLFLVVVMERDPVLLAAIRCGFAFPPRAEDANTLDQPQGRDDDVSSFASYKVIGLLERLMEEGDKFFAALAVYHRRAAVLAMGGVISSGVLDSQLLLLQRVCGHLSSILAGADMVTAQLQQANTSQAFPLHADCHATFLSLLERLDRAIGHFQKWEEAVKWVQATSKSTQARMVGRHFLSSSASFLFFSISTLFL